MRHTRAGMLHHQTSLLVESRRHHSIRLASAVFAGAVMMLAGVAITNSNFVQGTTPVNSRASFSLATAGSTSATKSASGLKAPLLGLLDRQKAPPAAFYAVLDGFVVNVDWASLQATAGGPITTNNAIDQAITQVRAANASGAHMALKLRTSAGIGAPAWAKSIGGAPITVRDPNSTVTGTVGRFWTPAFGLAYKDFETKLAAKYDAVPEIREVTISRCTTIYDEPFIRQMSDPITVANLWKGGYTYAADHTCQQQAVQAHAAWKFTRSDLSFNPYQEIVSGTSVKTDEAFTESMITYCTTTLGANCIVENNSLRSTSLGTYYDSMYAAMKAQSGNVVFQTATMPRVGSLSTTLQMAAGYGAGSVELPSGYQSAKPSTFTAARSHLIANVRL